MVHITNWQSILSYLIDSYGRGNRNGSIVLDAVGEGVGQAFTSPLTRIRLTDVVFQLQRNAAFIAPGTVEARLYRVLAGTVVGTTAVPDIAGGVLATSDAVLAADIPLAWGLVNFHFATPYTLDPELGYVIVVVATNVPAGQVEVGIDITIPLPLPPHIPTHPGNQTDNTTLPPVWTPNPLNDVIFYLFSFSDILAGGVVDVSDRWARQLGLIDISRVLGAPLTAANPVIAGLYGVSGDRVPVRPHDLSIPISPAKIVVQAFDSIVGPPVAVAEGDADNLAINTDHRGAGVNSVEFDKVGVVATTIAGVSYTIAALDLSLYSTHAQVDFFIYVPTPTIGTLVQVYGALGTDNINLFYWAIPAADIVLDAWNHVHLAMCDVSGVFGVGANLSAVTYCAVYVQMAANADTIAGVLVSALVVKRTFEVAIINSLPSLAADGLTPLNVVSAGIFPHVYDPVAGDWNRVRQGTAIGSVLTDPAAGSEEPYWITSDKDTHFTEAIIENAEEDENLAGLGANKIVITDVIFEGKENLFFRLLFWSKDTFEDVDLDDDSFLGFVDIDIPNNGFRKGAANQWYLNVTDVNLHYEDEDASNELHVSLNCVSAAGKTAGVPGEVKIKICYKVRE